MYILSPSPHTIGSVTGCLIQWKGGRTIEKGVARIVTRGPGALRGPPKIRYVLKRLSLPSTQGGPYLPGPWGPALLSTVLEEIEAVAYPSARLGARAEIPQIQCLR